MLTSSLADNFIGFKIHNNIMSKVAVHHLIAKLSIYAPMKSINFEESAVVVEDVSSSQGEAVILVAGASELCCQGARSQCRRWQGWG